MKISAKLSVLGILSTLLFPGCVVPQNRYDAAVGRLHSEETAHRADAQDLARTKAELARLSETLGSREERLASREGELAEAKLDTDRTTTERDDAVLMVEQLRGELGRVGDHLREFSDQKRALEESLADADLRAKRLALAEKTVEAKVLLVRDLSLVLAASIEAGKASVVVVDGKPAVRLDAREVWGEKGSEPSAGIRKTLGELGVVLAARSGTGVELGDRSNDSASAEDRIVRLQRIADVLTEKGVGFERIGFAVAPKAEEPEAKTDAVAPAALAETAEKPVEKAPSFRDGPGSVEIVLDVGLAS